jgi:hypothetical protein
MKNAIFILTDPQPASDEATTRLLNALGYADECQRCGDELAIVFAGTGTRWPQELAKLSHPANARYNRLREHVKGASRSCAVRNGAVEGLAAANVPLIGDNEIPGTAGVASFRRYYAEGWNVSIF